MIDAPRRPTGHFDMEILVGYVLFGGVVLSMVLIASGLTWRWAKTGHLGLDYSIAGMDLFEFAAHEVRDVAHEDVRPRRLVNLGFLSLMLTPYARVFASMLYFGIAERNWKYTLFTGIVLGLLTYALFLR